LAAYVTVHEPAGSVAVADHVPFTALPPVRVMGVVHPGTDAVTPRAGSSAKLW
jgi:hypothetical protein